MAIRQRLQAAGGSAKGEADTIAFELSTTHHVVDERGERERSQTFIAVERPVSWWLYCLFPNYASLLFMVRKPDPAQRPVCRLRRPCCIGLIHMLVHHSAAVTAVHRPVVNPAQSPLDHLKSMGTGNEAGAQPQPTAKATSGVSCQAAFFGT